MLNGFSVPHVLLVDDSLDELRLLKRILDAHQFKMSIAFDGHQGYQRAKTLQPDLILLDVRMPKMDGFGACRLLKADPLTRDIPVIFLSAANSLQERLTGLSIGGVDYVNKPFQAEEVLARVRIHLNLSTRQLVPDTAVSADVFVSGDEVLLQAAISLIRERLGEQITVEEIALSVGSHEKRLSAVFKSHTGMTVFAYLREERLHLARQWLAQGNISVQVIAEQLGFQNAGNFSTAFRGRFGLTPTAYRKQMQQEIRLTTESCA